MKTELLNSWSQESLEHQFLLSLAESACSHMFSSPEQTPIDTVVRNPERQPDRQPIYGTEPQPKVKVVLYN